MRVLDAEASLLDKLPELEDENEAGQKRYSTDKESPPMG